MNKFEKAQKILQELNIDGWLIICSEDSDIHSHYLLGVASHARHYVYIAADGRHKVLAVTMEAPMIEKSLKRRGTEVKVISYSTLKECTSLLTSIINGKRIALNYGENILDEKGSAFADYIHVGDYFSIQRLIPRTELISAAPIIEKLRSVKTSGELKDLRNTCKATIEILETIPDWVSVGVTEREVKAKLEYEYEKLGRSSFVPIVATGANSADPHHNSSSKKIETGVLLIDSGLQIDEMCSDITWTFWVGNKPTEEFLQAYNDLYEAKKIANKYYIDGTPNNVPAKKCREYLAEIGRDHEKLFFHGLGHAIGFEVHGIGQRINWKVPNDYVLKENMVYTNEPGFYWIDKWGVRLEDDVIIGKENCEQVTYVHEDPILI